MNCPLCKLVRAFKSLGKTNKPSISKNIKYGWCNCMECAQMDIVESAKKRGWIV